MDTRAIHLTIDPECRYHGTGKSIGGPRRPTGHAKTKDPNPDEGSDLADVSRNHTYRTDGDA
jgi:hypothetical protein